MNTTYYIDKQIPEHLREAYPKFVEFLKAYFSYMEENKIDLETVRDVDTTTDDFVDLLRKEFATRFPNAYIDNRKLIKLIRTIYNTKGTINSIDLLFRVFYGEAITVDQPGQRLLRASDGRWTFSTSFVLETIYPEAGTEVDGNLWQLDTESAITLTIENDYGKYLLEADSVELLGQTADGALLYKFYFRNITNIKLDPNNENQTIDIIEDGVVIYRGTITKTPSYINILSPGKYWTKGQVIVFPSSSEDGLPTIARVANVGPNGEIKSIDIYEYGTDHDDHETLVISPYPFKPAEVEYDISVEYVGTSYHYTLDINDGTGTITEAVGGWTSVLGLGSYFYPMIFKELEYPGEDYNMRKISVYKSIYADYTDVGYLQDPEVTADMWFESRAILDYVHDYTVDYVGQYVSESGHLSNPNIRLQDNFFFQLFSYVVNTTIDIAEYKDVINMVHPAGLKFFGNFNKTSVLEFVAHDSWETKSRTVLNFTDKIYPTEELTSTFGLGFDVVNVEEDVSFYTWVD